MLRDMFDMIWCSATTTANNVDKTFLSPFFNEVRSVLRLFIVLAHGVWQASVRVRGYVCGRNVGQLFDVRSHFFCAKCTVQPNTQRLCMNDGSIERF